MSGAPTAERRRRHRPVARAALDLLVRAAGFVAHRQTHLHEHLAVGHGGLVRAAMEVAHLDHALAARPADHGACLERGADGAQVFGRVGLAERAADRAAVTHERVGDHLLCVANDREQPSEQLRLEQLAVARQRAEVHRAVLLADVGELVKVVDVDEMLGRRQAQLHHREQAVTACDKSRVRAEAL
jgi:hypothetical protein